MKSGYSVREGELANKTAFLGTPGKVIHPERFSNADLLKAVGANTGNLVFQLAATRLFAGSTEHVGFSGKGYGDPTVYRGLDHFIFPAANHLRADGNWTLLTNFLHTVRVPLVILGLGAQADHGAGIKQTADACQANASVMAFVELIKAKAALITVRGAFTEAVCHEIGLPNVLRIGCPSQFINEDNNLGTSIARQFDEICDDVGSQRFALAASAPNELKGWRSRAESQMFDWLGKNGGLYIQQSCSDRLFNGPDGRLAMRETYEIDQLRRKIAPDMNGARFRHALAEKFRIYFDAQHWIEDLKDLRFVIGTRIHGNMAALAASRPGVLVVHDARVAELAEEMHVPKVGAAIFEEKPSIADVLQRAEFDAAVFDAARRHKARALVEAFSRIGVAVSEHLHRLAGAENVTQAGRAKIS